MYRNRRARQHPARLRHGHRGGNGIIGEGRDGRRRGREWSSGAKSTTTSTTIREIDGTENISAYEETTHHVITLQFHERGMALSMSYEEALELADAMQKVVVHIGRGRQRNGG